MDLPGFNLRWGQFGGASGAKSGVPGCSEAFSGGNNVFFSVLMLFLCVLVAKPCVFMAFLGKKIRPRRTWKGDCYAVSTERRGDPINGDKEMRIRTAGWTHLPRLELYCR